MDLKTAFRSISAVFTALRTVSLCLSTTPCRVEVRYNAVCIFNFSKSWMWVVSFTLWLLYRQGKNT